MSTPSEPPRADVELIACTDPVAQSAPLLAEMRAAIERLLPGEPTVLAAEIEAFEKELAAAIGCAHAIGVSSGADAVLAALVAVGVGPGDDVVTSALGSLATAGAITRLGARPIFVDVDPVTFHLDLGQIPPAVTERTKAILPVHLFGQPADMGVLGELAGAFAIPVVEDAARAAFAETPRGRVGTLGAVGCFSFGPASDGLASGELGAVSTDDGELARRVRGLRAHDGDASAAIGAHLVPDPLHAALLRTRLPHAAQWAAARRRHASLYDVLFMESGLSPALVVPPRRGASGHVVHRYVVRTPRRGRADRDGLLAFLAERGIAAERALSAPLHLQPCFAGLGQGPLPVAERAEGELLALPVHPALRPDQIERVVDTVAAYFDT